MLEIVWKMVIFSSRSSIALLTLKVVSQISHLPVSHEIYKAVRFPFPSGNRSSQECGKRQLM